MTSDMRFPQKKVDEAWKQQIEEERQKLEAAASAREARAPKTPSAASSAASAQAPPDRPAPSTSKQFPGLLQMLAMQAYMALGEMESPATGALEINLPQAKAFIDLLAALQEKTRGNLSKEEEDALNALVYELQLKYSERKAGL